MTDWQSDLEKLYEMCANPQCWQAESACEFLIGFLYHVVPHLNAAAKLLIDTVGDPFSEQQNRESG